MNKIFSLLILIFFLFFTDFSFGQSYYSDSSIPIPGYDSETISVITVSELLTPQLYDDFGLDSITLNINYSYLQDLEIMLFAPDGTMLQLAAELGGSGSDFSNTCFTMKTNTLINMGSAPFDGTYRPESWIGNINNGQDGNGDWTLRINNRTPTSNNGILVEWGLHFNDTPAPSSLLAESSLPIVVINTNNQVINYVTKAKIDATMGIISNENQENHIDDSFNEYDGNIQIKGRGSSSAGFPQHSYTITTRNEANDDDEQI